MLRIVGRSMRLSCHLLKGTSAQPKRPQGLPLARWTRHALRSQSKQGAPKAHGQRHMLAGKAPVSHKTG
jgi:hypothetical protein